jgi:CheY-like chemotaxis protein
VIDDERAVRELISDALKIEGHDVHTAENSKEGLDYIGRNRFDLVFCDLRMPEMAGCAPRSSATFATIPRCSSGSCS